MRRLSHYRRKRVWKEAEIMPNRFLGTRPTQKIAGALLLTASISIYSAPAQAGFKPVGFQWVGPGAQAPTDLNANQSSSVMVPNQAPVTIQAPTSTVSAASPEPVSPIVIEGHAPVAAPAPSYAPPAYAPPAYTPPAYTAPAPVAAAPSAQPEPVVLGFANSVPLAVALRQVLPSGYGFSIDQDVDLGTLVSFKGGQPWRETLENMLQPAGLSMKEQAQMVSISHAQPGVAPPPENIAMQQPAPMPPPAPAPAPTPVAAAPAPVIESMPTWSAPPMQTQPVFNTPAPAPAPAAVQATIETWSAGRGKTLHDVLSEWCRRSNVDLEWLAEYDYPLQASASFTGTFEQAVRGLLSGFDEAHPQPVAQLHANPAIAQRVLIVETRGNNYSD
jgi:hypothetical protein